MWWEERFDGVLGAESVTGGAAPERAMRDWKRSVGI